MYTILPHKYMSKIIQYRFPRCKSKRIANKWKKDKRNFKEVPRSDVLIFGQYIYAHPSIADQLTKQLEDLGRY
jgi:hypothetical protein